MAVAIDSRSISPSNANHFAPESGLTCLLASFLSPEADERREAAIAKRLDQQDRRLARLERDASIGVETLAS
jgi:hypothetical protein